MLEVLGWGGFRWIYGQYFLKAINMKSIQGSRPWTKSERPTRTERDMIVLHKLICWPISEGKRLAIASWYVSFQFVWGKKKQILLFLYLPIFYIVFQSILLLRACHWSSYSQWWQTCFKSDIQHLSNSTLKNDSHQSYMRLVSLTNTAHVLNECQRLSPLKLWT